ncbi:hypothetical protein P153DRAFT_355578 [Dothidotthia symphoricarpi CBS 119687]|uniref:Uncharacterized protein n=1 Tax=Dothidotthia symphoricarpi CBS 119687 TaxID=1392245 RepID=A0A6A6AI03_9PLEO|nr:uncharacterized protein P153DRAFT_355578 [Dothidotthia symphoricarpi CBS 119687]KAF2130725.1 hypothetical protein P153DRAFT_355578 [Dothidotthia symphoricarpi CBS 119687]
MEPTNNSSPSSPPPHLSLRRSNAVRRDPRTSYLLDESDPPAAGSTTPLQKAFSFEALSADARGAAPMLSDSGQQSQQSSNQSQTSSQSSTMNSPRAPVRVPKPRYYANALSEEDKEALTRGEKNHNLKDWTAKDMVHFHESRKELVPKGMDKLEKVETLAKIEREKQDSQRILDEARKKGSRSTDITRYSDASPPPDLQFQEIPPSPSTSLEDLPQLSSTHTRALNNAGSFLHPTRPRPSQPRPPSARISRTPHRVRSPLSIAVPRACANPNITFDDFLVLHISGKGEAYRGAVNAMREHGWDERNARSVEMTEVCVKEGKSGSLLKDMTSVGSLRKVFAWA